MAQHEIKFNELKVGDKYPLMTFECFQYLEGGGKLEDFNGQKYYDAVLKAVTPTGSHIIELNEIVYDELTSSMFLGKEIKEFYPDLDLDDNKKYCVTYSEDCPFYN